MIMGDQSMAALAQEIAAELSAEMGISMTAQQAVGAIAGRLGATAPLLDGMRRANQFVDGDIAARQQEF